MRFTRPWVACETAVGGEPAQTASRSSKTSFGSTPTAASGNIRSEANWKQQELDHDPSAAHLDKGALGNPCRNCLRLRRITRCCVNKGHRHRLKRWRLAVRGPRPGGN